MEWDWQSVDCLHYVSMPSSIQNKYINPASKYEHHRISHILRIIRIIILALISSSYADVEQFIQFKLCTVYATDNSLPVFEKIESSIICTKYTIYIKICLPSLPSRRWPHLDSASVAIFYST